MEIVIAKSAGFCFGVKRAVDSAYDILEKFSMEHSSNVDSDVKLYSIGPIIHNEKVMDDLKRNGLTELDDIEEITKIKNSKIIIRTHGIEKNIFETLKNNGNEIIDLTCPFVKKIHITVAEYSEKGYKIIVIGDKNHPEVRGIVSYASTDIRVVKDETDIENVDFDKYDKILIVFQTTMNVKIGKKLIDIFSNLFYNIIVCNTICNATEDRQREVFELSKDCDAMLIIGSANSSNTKKLYEISCKNCKNTFLLNDKNELRNIDIKNCAKIGVSAGASTPKYLIEEILTNARK